MVPVLVNILKFDDLANETFQKQGQIKVVFEHYFRSKIPELRIGISKMWSAYVVLSILPEIWRIFSDFDNLGLLLKSKIRTRFLISSVILTTQKRQIRIRVIFRLYCFKNHKRQVDDLKHRLIKIKVGGFRSQ